MASQIPKSGPVTLKANLAEYLNTKALRAGAGSAPEAQAKSAGAGSAPEAPAKSAGAVKSDLVTIDFCGPKIANQGFKPLIREARFDISESQQVLSQLSFCRRVGTVHLDGSTLVIDRFRKPVVHCEMLSNGVVHFWI